MTPITIGRETCGNPEAAAKLEWLETNGLGGFASSSILGLNTRRYHALLTAATHPPVGRVVMLSKFEEAVTLGDCRYELSTNRYPGAIHPAGYRYLREFRLDPCPTFIFDLDGVMLEKRVFMPHGENTTVIDYTIDAAATLELRPLIAFRDYHATTHRNDALNPNYDEEPGVAALRPYADLPPLYLAHNAAQVAAGAGWFYNFEFDRERERGLDFQEDLFNPLVLTFHLKPNAPATVIASTMHHHSCEAPALRDREMARRAALVSAAPSDDPLAQRLALASDQFLVQRGNLATVIAGYPWFGDWGRDTMIALPGLTLVNRRYDVARQILLAFAASMDQGMLPNRFPDAGDLPEYNTVDATLWFFEAVRAYVAASGDTELVRRLIPAMQSSIEWHRRGTRYGIHVDGDGLLACGQPGVQLTWMDVKIGDWVVTPRQGKPVEVQALWYNALRIMQAFGAKEYGSLADRARESFRAQFWNADADCLYDVIDGDSRDASIRPNQLFATSLEHRLLDDDEARRVLAVVQRELLTPAGLRTLSPRDPKYRGRYEGGPASRDSAYHQGTVWPWLMGPFLTAYTRLNEGPLPLHLRSAMETQLTMQCLGQLYEVADGDEPHNPGGCPAQAWSVAAALANAVGQASRPVHQIKSSEAASPVNQIHSPTARHRRKQAAKKRIAGHA